MSTPIRIGDTSLVRILKVLEVHQPIQVSYVAALASVREGEAWRILCEQADVGNVASGASGYTLTTLGSAYLDSYNAGASVVGLRKSCTTPREALVNTLSSLLTYAECHGISFIEAMAEVRIKRDES